MTQPNGVPDWFNWAIEEPHSAHQVEVEGCRINYLRWPPHPGPTPRPETPGLLFVHGGGAHARWWQFIAPFFQTDFEVTAIDLSGMGDSEPRPSYTFGQRAREVRAVVDATGCAGNTYLVGHSMGGIITMMVSAKYQGLLNGAVIVDAPILHPDGDPVPQPPMMEGIHKLHPSREAAAGRFRMVPTQPCQNDYIVSFIGDHSVTEVEGGWRWKFDPAAMGMPPHGAELDEFREYLAHPKCRTALIYGEKSALIRPQTAAYMSGLMGPRAPVVEIPDAYHHLMLDQPLAFVSSLRAMLAHWGTA